MDISYKNIWKIGYPIILGSLAQDIITVVDTAFVGRLGESELGGAAIGGIFYLAIVMIGWGFGLGVQIMIARRYGENKFSAINKILNHSFIILLILASTVFLVIHNFDSHIFNAIIQSPNVKSESLKFINIRIFGLFAAFININFRAFYIGTANTKIISYTTIVMAIVNITLDYLLIFGIGIFPKMGIEGAALASVISEYCALLFFIIFSLLNKSNLKLNIFKTTKLEFDIAKKIMRISTPTMIQNFISLSAWFIFFLFVEKMGETPLAISNIIRSSYIIILVPIFGFASATNTLISYSIGNNTPENIWIIIKKSLIMAMGGVGIFVIIGIIFPESIIGFYTNIESIIELTIPVFYMVMASSFTIAFGFIMFQAVSGTGNTITALIIEVIVLSLYLLGVYLISESNSPSIVLAWSMEFCYGLGLGILSFIYLKSGRWKQKKI